MKTGNRLGLRLTSTECQSTEAYRFKPPSGYDAWWFSKEGRDGYEDVHAALERIKTLGY